MTLRVELDDNTTVLLESSTASGSSAPYGPSEVVDVTLDALRKSVGGAMTVVAAVADECRSAGLGEIEIHFGLSVEGKADVKILSAGVTGTFDVTVTVKG